MEKQRIYAVRKGWKQGIFYGLDAVIPALLKFDHPEFKDFENVDLAKQYLEGHVDEILEYSYTSLDEINPHIKNKRKSGKNNSNNSQLLINGEKLKYPYCFVHGLARDGKYGFGGFVKVSHNSSPVTFKGSGNNQEMLQLGNVSGEMNAIVNSINRSINMGLKKINVYYINSEIDEFNKAISINDLEGVKKYKRFLISARKKIKINFIKIEHRKVDDGGRLASRLAREALAKTN